MISEVEDLDDLTSGMIYTEIRENSMLFHVKTDDIDTYVINQNHFNLGYIEKFVDNVITSDLLAFQRIVTTQNGEVLVSFQPIRLGIYLIRLPLMIAELIKHDQSFILSEKLMLLIECLTELGMYAMQPIGEWHPELQISHDKYLADCFNDLINLLRFRSQQTSFKKKLSNRRSNSERNYKTMRALIDSLFARHVKLLIVRLDLYYRCGINQHNRSLNNVTIEQAKSDFRRFLNNQRHNAIFKQLVGYIWKLENGCEKGFHYHFIGFFNGSLVEKDWHYANQLGLYWSDVITDKRGYFHNCNTDEEKDKYWSKGMLGIGMINAESENDKLLRCNLYNKVIRYLVKCEQYISYKFKKKERVFGTSHPLSSESKPGRKRSSQLADSELTSSP